MVVDDVIVVVVVDPALETPLAGGFHFGQGGILQMGKPDCSRTSCRMKTTVYSTPSVVRQRIGFYFEKLPTVHLLV